MRTKLLFSALMCMIMVGCREETDTIIRKKYNSITERKISSSAESVMYDNFYQIFNLPVYCFYVSKRSLPPIPRKKFVYFSEQNGLLILGEKSLKDTIEKSVVYEALNRDPELLDYDQIKVSVENMLKLFTKEHLLSSKQQFGDLSARENQKLSSFRITEMEIKRISNGIDISFLSWGEKENDILENHLIITSELKWNRKLLVANVKEYEWCN